MLYLQDLVTQYTLTAKTQILMKQNIIVPITSAYLNKHDLHTFVILFPNVIQNLNYLCFPLLVTQQICSRYIIKTVYFLSY